MVSPAASKIEVQGPEPEQIHSTAEQRSPNDLKVAMKKKQRVKQLKRPRSDWAGLADYRIRLKLPPLEERRHQGVTKGCRLSWLTNSALVNEPKWGGEGVELRGLSQWVQLYTVALINFGDLTPYLTYGRHYKRTWQWSTKSQMEEDVLDQAQWFERAADSVKAILIND